MTILNNRRLTHLDWDGIDLEGFPLLRLAVERRTPVYSMKIEWSGEEYGLRENYTQIVRVRFVSDAEDGFNRGLALARLFAKMEAVLLDGVPGIDESLGYPVGYCGGVRHFLGRAPVDSDIVRLRVLRDPVLLHSRFEGPGDEQEWLVEFTMDVT